MPYIYFFNNSDLFIGCKLHTMNVAQRQDIILLPKGKREGKKKGDREKWREERHRESEEAMSFWTPTLHLVHLQQRACCVQEGWHWRKEAYEASSRSPILLLRSCHGGNMLDHFWRSQNLLGPPLSARAKHRGKCCTGADGLWYLAPSCLLQT